MNPFDLRGPEFLLFYTVLGAAVVALLSMARHLLEAGGADAPLLRDYLEIAYLRGGPAEAIRVATVNLFNRGLIDVNGDLLQASAGHRVLPEKRLEQQILTTARTATYASQLFSDESLQEAAAEECAPALLRRGLLPDARTLARRRSLLMATAVLLVIVAGIKVAVALARGRTNIAFLVIEAIVLVAICAIVTRRKRTSAGDEQLSNLRSLFWGLRERSNSIAPDSGQDLALLAAVFGTAYIPPAFGLSKIFPRATTSGSSCGSGCGTSASSSSSCGSSCGGGGGGGGCGGCGS